MANVKKYVDSAGLQTALTGLKGKTDKRYLLKGEQAASAAKVKSALTINDVIYDGSTAQNFSLAEKLHHHSAVDITDFKKAVTDALDDVGGTAHAHANMSTLDLITSSRVQNWDAKIGESDVAKLLYSNAGMSSVGNVSDALDVLVANVQIGSAEISAATKTLNSLDAAIKKEVTDRGNAISGLDTKITNNTNAINKLNGSSSTEGSVDYKIKQKIDTVNSNASDLANRVTSAESKLNTLNGSSTTAGSVAKALADAKSYADGKIADFVDSAPETLDTLNELAAALGDDPNFATTITNKIADKASNDAVNALTTKVNTNITNIATLNAGDTTAGSVDYKIKAAKEALNVSISGIGTRTTALEDKVGAAAGSGTSATGLFKEIADLKTKNTSQDTAISTAQGKANANAETIATVSGTVNGHTTDIYNLQTSVANIGTPLTDTEIEEMLDTVFA